MVQYVGDVLSWLFIPSTKVAKPHSLCRRMAFLSCTYSFTMSFTLANVDLLIRVVSARNMAEGQ